VVLVHRREFLGQGILFPGKEMLGIVNALSDLVQLELLVKNGVGPEEGLLLVDLTATLL
jgi:hypothetical protein